ncbi:MAG: hypothetical protein ACI9IN_001778, partial [Porticoccaceae bacterium]
LYIGPGRLKTTVPVNNFSLRRCVFTVDTKKAACAALY